MKSRFMGFSFEQFLAALCKDFPLLGEFSSTEQDPGWHGEGNVAVHTNLVLQQVYFLIETCASHLSVREQDVLILSALFHDYGKPLTTRRREKDGVERVVAPYHEHTGASLLFTCSPPLGITQEDWKDIIQLVAYHDQPKKLVYMNKGEADYRALSRKIPSMEMIYLLEVADRKGTVSDDYDEQLEMLEVFRLFSEELGLWRVAAYEGLSEKIDEHFADKDDLFRMAAYHKGMSALDKGRIHLEDEVMSIAYQNQGKSHVVVMCAISGSGKSTFIKKNYPEYRVISPDEIRELMIGDRLDIDNHGEVFRFAYEQLKVSLRIGENVVWDATNLRIDLREKLLGIANDYGAFIEMVLLQAPLAQCLKNNRDRTHSIPAEIIHKQAKIFQLPDLREVHKLTWLHSF